MDTPTIPSESEDALFEFERRIARRADELSRGSSEPRSQTLLHWLAAEREVWQESGGPMATVR